MSNIVKEINVASPNNFQLVLNKTPVIDFISRPLTLYIYDSVVPAVSFNENIMS